MLPCRRTNQEELFITELPVSEGAPFLSGLALTPLGSLHISESDPVANVVNGIPVSDAGAVCVAYGEAVNYHFMGLPFTSDDRLVRQLNQSESSGDAYVAGIRIGSLGGVYVTDAEPDPFLFRGFSLGFDEGFG